MSITTAPRIVTDGEKLTCAERTNELFMRFKKGVYQNPSEVLDGLQRLIEGKLPEVIPTLAQAVATKVAEKVAAQAKTFTTWLKAKVGGLTKDEIVRKLDKVPVGNGLTFRLGDWAKNILFRPECVVMKTASDAEFAIATPAELGFTENPTTEQLFDEKNLAGHGLELCLPDDGPSLRLAYTDQPGGEWLPIAMKPIRHSGGGWGVFDLRRDGSELWLLTDYGAGPQIRWPLGFRLVFRRRKAQN